MESKESKTPKFKVGDKVRIVSPKKFAEIFAMLRGNIAGDFIKAMFDEMGKVGEVEAAFGGDGQVLYALNNIPWYWDERLLTLEKRKPAKNEIPEGVPAKLLIEGIAKPFQAEVKFKGAYTYATIRADNKAFIGQAHCSPQDVWSRNKGAEIATTRAMLAWYRARLDLISR